MLYGRSIELKNSRVRFSELTTAAREERPRFIPKSPPRVRVVTTVLQMPDVWDIHVRNLLWALGNPRIYMLTHRGVDLPEHPNIDYVYAKNLKTREELPPEELTMKMYGLYDELAYLDFSDVDVVLFMQNDIFFTDKEKVAAAVEECHEDGKIVLSLNYQWSHTIYDKGKKPQLPLRGKQGLVYPRVWDGGTFVPARLIEQATADRVELGYSRNCTLRPRDRSDESRWLYDFALENWSDYWVGMGVRKGLNDEPLTLVDLLTYGDDGGWQVPGMQRPWGQNPPAEVRPYHGGLNVVKLKASPTYSSQTTANPQWRGGEPWQAQWAPVGHFTRKPRIDGGTVVDGSWELMYEFSLYALFKNVPFRVFGGYHMSPHAVHFQGARCLMNNSNGLLKEDLRTIDRVKHRGGAGEVAFMCLMCGLAPMDKLLKSYLLRDNSYHWARSHAKFDALSRSADQWMSPDQLKRLEWASKVLKGQGLRREWASEVTLSATRERQEEWSG